MRTQPVTPSSTRLIPDVPLLSRRAVSASRAGLCIRRGGCAARHGASAYGKPTPNLAAFGQWWRASPTTTPPCVIRRRGPTARACAARMDRRFAANHCATTPPRANARRCPALGIVKAETGRSRFQQTRIRAPRCSRRRWSWARHAVFGVGHHRAQLPRHRPRGRCARSGLSIGIRPCRWALPHLRRHHQITARSSSCTRCATSPS